MRQKFIAVMAAGAVLAAALGSPIVSGAFDSTIADGLQRFLLARSETAEADWDLDGDGTLSGFDYCLAKRTLIAGQSSGVLRTVSVSTVDQLYAALEDAQAGDEIVLAPGTYSCTKIGSKGALCRATAEGTQEHPIVLRSQNPEQPAVLSGITAENNYVLHITGDYWQVADLTVTNGQKGFVLDHANYAQVLRCTVTEVGSEGIHLRDGSSNCLVSGCTVTNTGRVSPGYGEAVYVGSAYTTSGYAFDCDNNTISGCTLGPGVTGEMVDIKEYTTGTIVEFCTMDGSDLSGETSANACLKAKGNDAIIRNNTCYSGDSTILRSAFENHMMVANWGFHNQYLDNVCYLNSADAYVLRVYDGSAITAGCVRYPEGNLCWVDSDAELEIN